MDYHVGRSLARRINPSVGGWLSSITTNLGLLGFFKYTNFLVANAGWAARLLRRRYDGVALRYHPAGRHLVLHVQEHELHAGCVPADHPAVRKHPGLPALRLVLPATARRPDCPRGRPAAAAGATRVRATSAEIESGLAQFGLGAVKKLVIADQVAGHVDLIFAAPGQFDALTLLQGACGYAVQIYCDFSGYSDMAIGVARIMGYRTAENFQMPYSAVNITEFWHRWHISLSSWFRDYLFLPSAYRFSRRMHQERYLGVRVDLVIYVAAILTTFAVCGLWHGASWTFVVWGCYHGMALGTHRAWKVWRPFRRLGRNPAFRLGSVLAARMVTLTAVVAGWVFFRADSLGSAGEDPSAHRYLGVGRHAPPFAAHLGGRSCGVRGAYAGRQGPQLG